MGKITIYDALCLDDLNTLNDFFRKQGTRTIYGLLAPTKKDLGKSTYFEAWSNALTEAMEIEDSVVVLGSYWIEHFVISPALGIASNLTQEEMLILQELEQDLEIEKFIVTSAAKTEREVVLKIADSYSKRFPSFSAIESSKILSTMMDFEKNGFTFLDLSDIINNNMVEKDSKQELVTVKPEIKSGVPHKAQLQEAPKEVPFDPSTKLEIANAISSVINKRIIKKKGLVFDALDEEIRVFLKDKLNSIFQQKIGPSLTTEEVVLVKTFVGQLKNKMERK